MWCVAAVPDSADEGNGFPGKRDEQGPRPRSRSRLDMRGTAERPGWPSGVSKEEEERKEMKSECHRSQIA